MPSAWNKLLEEANTLLTKIFKLATELGVSTLLDLGYESKVAFREKTLGVWRKCRGKSAEVVVANSKPGVDDPFKRRNRKP